MVLGLPTVGGLVYDSSFPDVPPIKWNMVDGDQTVPAASLRSCESFPTNDDHVTEVRAFEGEAEHRLVLGNDDMLDHFLSLFVERDDVNWFQQSFRSLFGFL